MKTLRASEEGNDSELPREALRQLQRDAHLTPEQAKDYLEEVLDERLAAEDRGKASFTTSL